VIKLSMLSDDKLKLNEELPSDEFAKALSWWHMLRNAVEGAKKNQQVREEAEAFKAKATLSTTEFFTSKKSGTFALHHPSWKVPDRRTGKDKIYKHVLWLIERDKDGNVRVVEVNNNKGSRELYELDDRIVQPTPADELLYPLKALLSAAERYYQNGLEMTKKDEGKKLAAKREAEAQAELEAKRELVAQAEAKRVAAKQG